MASYRTDFDSFEELLIYCKQKARNELKEKYRERFKEGGKKATREGVTNP